MFTTLQLPILNGRGFTAQDHAGAADVVVLGAETARCLFGERDPIGRRITPGDDADPNAQWFTVIGVAADIPTGSVLDAARDPMLYLPLRDSGDDPRSVGLVPATLLVRANADPSALAPAIRGIIDEADATVAPSRIRTLDQVLMEDRATLSFATLLLVFAGSMGLALSALGVYAVFAFSIARRAHEFGLRVALGASASDIAGIVFRQAGAITLAGVVVDLAAAAATTRLLGSLLFGVSPLDPATLAAATLLLLATAALRATRDR